MLLLVHTKQINRLCFCWVKNIDTSLQRDQSKYVGFCLVKRVLWRTIFSVLCIRTDWSRSLQFIGRISNAFALFWTESINLDCVTAKHSQTFYPCLLLMLVVFTGAKRSQSCCPLKALQYGSDMAHFDWMLQYGSDDQFCHGPFRLDAVIRLKWPILPWPILIECCNADQIWPILSWPVLIGCYNTDRIANSVMAHFDWML